MERQYLHIEVFKTDGSSYYNHLMMKEAYLINAILKTDIDGIKKLEVKLAFCSRKSYKCLFGI